MTESNHYREAEQSLKRVMNANSESDERFHLGVAQVHATLALAESNAKATTAPAVQPTALPDSQTELVTGLRALVDMFDANPQLGELNRYTFNHINVPLNIADDPRDALQTMVAAALAHGATPSLLDSGDYVGVLLSWSARVSVHVYDKPERLGDVAALLPAVEAVDA